MELIAMLVILAAASVLCLIPAKSDAQAPAITVLSGTAVAALAIRVALTASTGTPVIAIPNWLTCDGFGALLVVLVSYIGVGTAIFSWGNMPKPKGKGGSSRLRRYYCLYNLFVMAMLAVPMIAQISLVWIALELTTLTSVFLVSYDKTPEAYEAAWKYAILTTMGAIVALFGILLLYWGMRLAGGSVHLGRTGGCNAKDLSGDTQDRFHFDPHRFWKQSRNGAAPLLATRRVQPGACAHLYFPLIC